jgi:hypothetical protein
MAKRTCQKRRPRIPKSFHNVRFPCIESEVFSIFVHFRRNFLWISIQFSNGVKRRILSRLLILGCHPTLTASEFFTIVNFEGSNRQPPTNIAQLESFKDIISKMLERLTILTRGPMNAELKALERLERICGRSFFCSTTQLCLRSAWSERRAKGLRKEGVREERMLT